MAGNVLITGATSGIGEACARKFARQGYNLILCGRRGDKLQILANELSEVSVTQLVFDIGQKTQINDALESIEDVNIDILINNAGNAHGLDLFQEGSVEDWEQMIDVNVKGVLYVTRILAPKMIERGGGQIINLGSIAGLEVYPKGNVYCASKHAIVAISKAMSMDFLGKNIKVTCINPGMVETEFSAVRFKGDSERASKVYENMKPLLAEDIADVIYFAASQPAHVNISEITVMPSAQASATLVHRSL